VRQLTLACIKGTRRRREPSPETPPLPNLLKAELQREVVRLMAQAIIAVARRDREDGHER
jgi:hypothetical protein